MFFNKSKRSVDAVHAASVKDKNTDLKKERGRVEVGFRDDPPLAYNNFILKKLKKNLYKYVDDCFSITLTIYKHICILQEIL